eukprot:4607004-Alexandrium_andersonii.AAC.1
MKQAVPDDVKALLAHFHGSTLRKPISALDMDVSCLTVAARPSKTSNRTAKKIEQLDTSLALIRH